MASVNSEYEGHLCFYNTLYFLCLKYLLIFKKWHHTPIKIIKSSSHSTGKLTKANRETNAREGVTKAFHDY